MPIVHGRFEVQRTPQGPVDLGDGASGMHARFDKTFEGPLSGRSVVHMLAVGTPHDGSAGYVAVERFTGTLDGRDGAFVMLHLGVMDGGTPSLRVEIVPDSADGALAGLRGTLAIEIADGEHRYTLDYTLDGG